MKEERIKELAYTTWNMRTQAGVLNCVKQALAERDREVEEWVQANLVIKEHWGLQLVHADDLLAFLKGEK